MLICFTEIHITGGKDVRYYFLAAAIIVLDQVTKWLVATQMGIGQSLPIWKGVLSITSSRNQGAAFGILQGKMWLFYIITVIVVVGVIFYLQKYGRRQPLLGVALSLVLAGAIGNFIDRIFRGEVVDFIYFRIINFPVFNVADSALTIGVILIFIHTLFDGQKEKNHGESHANS
ncbi:MAG TPA: signal peptidase II [Bacillales bacterium]|nr:signal peptidase II [Bacillales bacterium]